MKFKLFNAGSIIQDDLVVLVITVMATSKFEKYGVKP